MSVIYAFGVDKSSESNGDIVCLLGKFAKVLFCDVVAFCVFCSI